ncbi:hypothetical protein C7S15_7755 [Burkholderia cepacia]|nr:hypothetical protein [Burkholderia cepacia]
MLRRAGGRFAPIAARSRRDAAPAPALCCHAGCWLRASRHATANGVVRERSDHTGRT